MWRRRVVRSLLAGAIEKSFHSNPAPTVGGGPSDEFERAAVEGAGGDQVGQPDRDVVDHLIEATPRERLFPGVP